ncbi:MAG: carboxypeptidase regulatory-like domain-containing protein [Verrucomicrobia bacterium]|nr:carboxypeptidase regulatory-like domain-containing protein [Verrucomicrobiota bacterium]
MKYEALRLTYTGTIGIVHVERETVCSAQGIAILELPAGRWGLEVVPTESEPYWGIHEFDIAEGNTEVETEFPVHKTSLRDVEVTVLYESDEKPIAAATVLVSTFRKIDRCEVAGVTDAKGILKMEGLWAHEKYRLMIHDERLPGFRSTVIGPKEMEASALVWRVHVPPPSTPVTVQLFVRDGDERIPFTVQRAEAELGEIKTRYLDCVGALVDPQSQTLSPYCGDAREQIDADGKCVIEGLRPGTYLVRNVRIRTATMFLERKYYFPVDGDISFTVPEEVTDGIQIETVVAAEPVHIRLDGRVIDTWKAEPLPDVTVKAELLAPVDAAHAQTTEVKTRKDGTFVLELEPAIYKISVQQEGFAGASEVIYMLPGKSVELRVHPVFTVKGSVAFEGAPAASAQVTLSKGDQEFLDLSDEEGVFEIEDVPPGRYLLLVLLRGFPTYAREVQITQDANLDVALDRGVTLSGTVTTGETVEAKRALVLLFVDVETRIAEACVTVSADGQYRTAVGKKQLAVYVSVNKQWYALGKLTVDKDEMTQDFHVTKETLEKPLDRGDVFLH